MRCKSSCSGYDPANRMSARTPVSIGLLNGVTVWLGSGIVFHPSETIIVGEMVANPVLVLGLDPKAQRVAIRREISGLDDSRANPRESIRIIQLVSIDDSVVDFFPNRIEGAWIDTITRETAKRLGVVEDFSGAIKVSFHFGPLRQFRDVIDRRG